MKFYKKLSFVRFKQKTLPQKICNIFQKLFGGFKVNYRKTVGEYYLSKYPTVLAPYFSQVYLSKHAGY